MKTQMELRSFTWGLMAGLFIIVLSFAGASEFAGVRWQPIKSGEIKMPSLYIAYSAQKSDASASVNGWITLRNTAPPQSTEDIKSICDKIQKYESLHHVIPIWWKALQSE